MGWENVIQQRIAKAKEAASRTARAGHEVGSPFDEKEAASAIQASSASRARRGTISVPVSQRNKAINDEIRRAAGRGEEGGD